MNKIKRKVGKECDLIDNIFVWLVYYYYFDDDDDDDHDDNCKAITCVLI